MENDHLASYPLDSAGIVHLAAIRKDYTNSFRVIFTLKDSVCAEKLQEAVNSVVPRFPAVIAGICPEFFEHRVVSVNCSVQIYEDSACLAPMTKKEIRTCAFRVLYGRNTIAAEFFHALTDGYGGMVVTSTIVAEYLRRCDRSAILPFSEMIVCPDEDVANGELRDDYITFAGKKGATPPFQDTYQVPGDPGDKVFIDNTQTNIRKYPTNSILAAAHHYGVSVTVLLSAVMFEAVAEIRNNNQNRRQSKEIQIMVPVNLRKLFGSRTLRSFSLYALYHENQYIKTFEDLISDISNQMSEQTTQDHMTAMMAASIKIQQFLLYKVLPLPVKLAIIRIVQYMFGESGSCITMSNLGELSLPDEMAKYIEGVDFVLTPRMRSHRNCGIVTYNGEMSICFSRQCQNQELEEIFFSRLETIMAMIPA